MSAESEVHLPEFEFYLYSCVILDLGKLCLCLCAIFSSSCKMEIMLL
jgi:hypothetical protein